MVGRVLRSRTGQPTSTVEPAKPPSTKRLAHLKPTKKGVKTAPETATNCHDSHHFSSFSTLSPRHSHSFCSTMTYFYPLSYLILSFFSLSYLLRSRDQDGKRDLIGNDYLQFRAIPKTTMRTSGSMDPISGDVPPSQELPVPPDRLHRIQLLPGKHLRRRTPQSVWRPELYQSPDPSLVLLPRQVHLERWSHRC